MKRILYVVGRGRYIGSFNACVVKIIYLFKSQLNCCVSHILRLLDISLLWSSRRRLRSWAAHLVFCWNFRTSRIGKVLCWTSRASSQCGSGIQTRMFTVRRTLILARQSILRTACVSCRMLCVVRNVVPSGHRSLPWVLSGLPTLGFVCGQAIANIFVVHVVPLTLEIQQDRVVLCPKPLVILLSVDP